MNTRPETDPMRHLLILNPNTDPTLTAKLISRARGFLPEHCAVSGVTARFGARYITCRTSLVIAAYATLDTFAHAFRSDPPLITPDTTVLLACFGDPGLSALQEITGCAVTGMARASLLGCRNRGGRTGIVTGGAAWKPLIEELVIREGFTDTIAGIRTTPDSGEHAGVQRNATVQALLRAARDLIDEDHADHILIAGAGMAGFSTELAALLPVPVHCSFEESLSCLMRTPLQPEKTRQSPLVTTGLSPDLTALLLSPA